MTTENGNRPEAENDSPLIFSVAIARESGRTSISHNIGAGSQGVKDVTFLLEAIGSVSRDLNGVLVDLRVQEAISQAEEEPEPASKRKRSKAK